MSRFVSFQQTYNITSHSQVVYDEWLYKVVYGNRGMMYGIQGAFTGIHPWVILVFLNTLFRTPDVKM